VQQFKGYTFTHDADGNLTRKVGTGTDLQYRWDELSRLTAVVNVVSHDSVQYFYDAHDRLAKRMTNGVTDRYWVWNGDALVAELGAGLTQKYIYADAGIDAPVLGKYTDATGMPQSMYAVDDARGNVLGWMNQTGNVVQTVRYDSWGTPTSSDSTISSRLWKGLLWNQGTAYGGGSHGLYYMRARWYDPELGRFLGEDPIGITGGLNLYTFGGNDPISKKDPSGLCCYESMDPKRDQISQMSIPTSWREAATRASVTLAAPFVGVGLALGSEILFGGTGIASIGRSTGALAAAGRLADQLRAQGKEILADFGDRVLTLNPHAELGSPGTGSSSARDWSSIGISFEQAKQAVVSELGNLSSLSSGATVRTINVGSGMVRFKAYLQSTGEVMVNFWVTQ
jgi:RHS repeat-associated protein